MEADVASAGSGLARVSMAFCFVDLTGFTRYTEEDGDEVMVVSPDPAPLTEWSVGFLQLFQERPQPRVGVHYGAAVFRDGDYFGGDVNLTHRVVSRALGGEVLVTQGLVDATDNSDVLRFDAIGDVVLKGFPEPISLYIAGPTME